MSPETITLRDESSGATAAILAGLGFNCYSFRPAVAGEPLEVLWAEPDFAAGDGRPTRSGIPLLFPFPGRIRGATFDFDGRTYTLEDDGRGNAIHGFVLNRPWRVTERTATRVTGAFQASTDDLALLDRWPADFRITLTYQLAPRALRAEIVVTNPDSRPLPFGFGAHPYVRVPLGPGGDAGACRITVPAAEYWELDQMLPTGRRLPAGGARDLSAGVPFRETNLDDVLTGLTVDNGRCRTTIVDPGNGRTLVLTFGAEFPNCVVYNPAHREAICIEPYGCVPDPFVLQANGVESGLRVLQPNQVFSSWYELGIEE
jgi:aldose 1-epimerase